LNTSVLSQENARSELLGYLHKIPPGASLAIFTLSSRLHLVQGFTTDTAQLAKALQGPKAAPQASALDGPSADALITAMARMGGPAAELAARDRQLEKEIAAVNGSDRAQTTRAALQQLARYLSSVPGRKNLIWFSTFFPFDLDSETSQLLAASRVAVYPVDARGLCPPTAISAVPGCQDSFQVQAEYDSMEKKIAEETGGHVFTSDFGSAVASIVENNSSYYTLGYAPHTRHPAPGFRKIEIRLDHAKYRLAYRRSYYDPGNSAGQSPESINPVAAAMLFGAPPSTQILIDAHVRYLGEFPSTSTQGAVSGSGNTLAGQAAPHRYLLDLSVNPRSLIFNQASNGDRNIDLRCIVAAYGPDAQPVKFSTSGYRLNVPAEQYARLIASEIEDNIPVRVTLDLPTGPLTLRAVVYDPATNQTGSLEIPLPVAAH
jgi:VWFA-related protein